MGELIMSTQEKSRVLEDEEVTREEIICMTIDRYVDLQRIKMANNGIKNEELEYQIKCTALKLSAIGIKEDDIKNITGGA